MDGHTYCSRPCGGAPLGFVRLVRRVLGRTGAEIGPVRKPLLHHVKMGREQEIGQAAIMGYGGYCPGLATACASRTGWLRSLRSLGSLRRGWWLCSLHSLPTHAFPRRTLAANYEYFDPIWVGIVLLPWVALLVTNPF